MPNCISFLDRTSRPWPARAHRATIGPDRGSGSHAEESDAMNRIGPVLAALVIGAACLAAAPARAQPVPIRVGWVVVPFEVIPVLFQAKDQLRHEGASYVFEPVHVQSAATALIALAGDDLDLIGLNPLTIGTAIVNARLDDIRALCDEYQDGVDGYYSNGFLVLNDGPVKTIDDLKGRAVVTLGLASSADIAIRAMLLQHGLAWKRDYADLEAAPQNMKAMLKDGKVALMAAAGLTTHDPDLLATTHVLFSRRDALGGPSQESTFFARSGFIAGNRAALVDFLEDYLRALRWFAAPANHPAVVRMVADFTKVPPGRFESWIFTRDDEYRDLNGLPDLASIARVIGVVQRLGLLSAAPDIANYADLSLVKEAAARLN
jgi:sulfonate transport system substrate-binding protein